MLRMFDGLQDVTQKVRSGNRPVQAATQNTEEAENDGAVVGVTPEEILYNIISDADRSSQVSGLYGGGYSHDKMPGGGQEIDQSSSPQNYGGQMTRSQLEGEYGRDPYLQSTFGSFDNYMAYMGDASGMLGQQSWWDATGVDKRTAGERISDYEGGGDLAYNGNQSQINDNRQSDANARKSGYNSWISSEENQGLMNKYGIQQKITAENGDIYEWTGNNYMRTYVAERMGAEDLVKAGIVATVAGGLGAGFAPMVSGGLGITSGFGTGAVQGGLGALAGGALQGDIDPRSIAVGALMGGLNPGGMLSDKMGLNPKSFAGGFVGGGTNSLVGGVLQNGDIDAQGALMAGLQAGGMNSVINAWDAIQNNTPEALMSSIHKQHRADYRAIHGNYDGYIPLTESQLYQVAMSMPMVNKTNFGSLIGEGGLISAIPEMDISGLAGLKDKMFGFAHGTRLFEDAQGNQLTNADLFELGYDPQEVFEGSLYEGTNVDGYRYVGSADATNPDGLFSQFTEWAGDTKVGNAIGTALDVAANAQFKNKYGFLPQDNPGLAQQISAYGSLTENYSWADNPRGDSEMFGSTFWQPGEFSKGLLTYQTNATQDDEGNNIGGTRSAIQVSQETIDQINEMGEAQREEILNSPFIINYQQQQQDQIQVDTSTGGAIDENTVLPGAENNPFMDQLIAALQGGATGETTEDNATGEVTSEVTDNPPANTDVQVGNSDYRNQQITEMLGQTIDSLPENTDQVVPYSDRDALPEMSEELLAAAMLLAGGGSSNGSNGLLTLEDDGSDNPYWTPLDGYSKVSRWRKSRDRVYNDIEGLLTATGKAPEYAMSKKQMTEEGLLS
jgi:hypothetical protein